MPAKTPASPELGAFSADFLRFRADSKEASHRALELQTAEADAAANGRQTDCGEPAMQTIVTLTVNPAVDTSSSVSHVTPDHKLRCSAPRHDPGGGGINVSRAIRKLGGDSLAVYTAGGPTGELLKGLLDKEGVRQEPLAVQAWTRENLYVLEETTRHQYRFIMPGGALEEGEWVGCLEYLDKLPEKPAYVVASGSLAPGVPDDFFARVARVARRMGSKFILDTRQPALGLALKEGIYLTKPNLHELCELAGHDLRDEPSQAAAALALVRSGQCEIVVLSLGPAGALVATAEGTERLRAPSVRVHSRVGAGDSMLAGIVTGLARGMLLRGAVRYGIAAGAAATLNPGTQLCSREDTDRLFELTG
jgi:6-phosphofructokinase 2